METTQIVKRLVPQKPLLGAAAPCCITLDAFKVKVAYIILDIIRMTGAKIAHRRFAFNATQSRRQPHLSQDPYRNHLVNNIATPIIFAQPKQVDWHVTATLRPKHDPLAAVERVCRQVAKTNEAADAQVICCRRRHGLNGRNTVTRTRHINEAGHSLHKMVRYRETRAKASESLVSKPAALSRGTTGL